MKDRIVTIAGAAVAGLVLYSLFFGTASEPPVTRPLSTEAGRNGYLAVADWLRREGVAVESFQVRFEHLLEPESALAGAGNILVTTMPHRYPLRRNELQSVRAWVRRGNTLLVLAALDDTPEWTAGSSTLDFPAQIEALTGLGFDVASGSVAKGDEDGEAAPFSTPIGADSEVVLEPESSHPLLEGVESLGGYSDQPSSLWNIRGTGASGSLLLVPLASERSSGLDALWQLPLDSGQIVVAASGTLLENHTVGATDAGRFLENLIEYHLADDGAVIFDDMHQGLTSLYDPDAFYGDPRLHATIFFLIAAWLVYLLGSSNRLAPPRPDRNEPKQATLLEAVGGFMARRVDRRAMGRLMLNEWLAEVAGARTAGGIPPWNTLDRLPALTRAIRRELQRAHERLDNDRPVNLTRLHNTLCQARKAVG